MPTYSYAFYEILGTYATVVNLGKTIIVILTGIHDIYMLKNSS